MAKLKKENSVSLEIKQTKEIDKFDPNSPAKLGHDLFETNNFKWNMNVFSFRLLLMIAQQANKETSEIAGFTEWQFDIDTVYRYLGFNENTSRKDKASVLQKALDGILTKSIWTKSSDGEEFEGVVLCWKASKKKNEEIVKICLTPAAVPFLCHLNRFAMIKPYNVMKLDTPYKQVLYGYFRDIANRNKTFHCDVLIFELKNFLGLSESYNDEDGKRDFCRRVLGIKRPVGWKYNKVGSNTPWEYIRNKNGECTGTLYGINTDTDIEVMAFAYSKKDFDYIHFAITEKQKIQNQITESVEKKVCNDVFVVWERCCLKDDFFGVSLPPVVMLDSECTHYWWMWHETMDPVSVKELSILLSDCFSKIVDGSSWSIVDTQVRSVINEYKAKNNKTPSVEWLQWKVITKLHKIKHETFSLQQVIDEVRLSNNENVWKKLDEAITEVETRQDIKNVTSWIIKCIKSK